MRIRASRAVGHLIVVPLLTASLAGASGCGNKKETNDSAKTTDRARQVAAAWDGSTAAAVWRAGYRPMGQVIQLPRGGLRSEADKQAYRDRKFVLRGKMPVTWPKEGRVTWGGKGSLTRRLVGPHASFETLADPPVGEETHLTVTGVKLGEMRLATSRGPATAPAWLFALDGYASPLKMAAALPSDLPRSPIGRAHDIPGYPINRLVKIAADGRSVSVMALHGVCEGPPVVDAVETGSSVVLSSSVKPHGASGKCTDQAKMQLVTVTLKHPLDQRVLLDAITGQPVPYKGLHTTSSR